MGVQIQGDTGNVIATKGTFSGDVGIAGTLTYEDVTNIDSVGLITARNGIEIGARPGVAASISVDGNMIVSGITTFGDALSGTTGTFSGRVLIGTTTEGSSASDDLTIATSGTTGITIRSGTSNNGNIEFSDGTSGQDEYRGVVQYAHSDNSMRFYTNAAEKVRIDSSGRLGIGTDSGTRGLNVEGTGTAARAFFNDSSNHKAVEFGADSTGSFQSTIGANPHLIYTNGTERLRITSAGQMVMGATTSKAKFEIKDNGYTSSTVLQRISTDDANPYALIIANDTCNTSAASGLQLFLGDSGTHYIRARGSSTAGNNNLLIQAQNDIRFGSGSSETERVRIGSEGNLALGGTNTAAYASQAHFFIGGVGDIYADTGTGSGKSLSISNNAYINTSGNWVYRATDKASNIYQYDGITGFRYASSGTAGNTITWSEAVRITNDGFVLIGTTSTTPHTNLGIGLRPDAGILVGVDGTHAAIFSRHNSNGECVRFQKGTADVGSIDVTGSSTSYNTSSDYRLKENVVAISDGITRLKALKPYRFNFKAEPDKTVDGFFAHEVSPIIPEAVTGEKDAEDMQQLDYSKLTPLLTAALQEAVTEIESLKARLDAAGL